MLDFDQLSPLELTNWIFELIFILVITAKAANLFIYARPVPRLDLPRHQFILQVSGNPELKYLEFYLTKQDSQFTGMCLVMYPGGIACLLVSTFIAIINLWLGILVLVIMSSGELRFSMQVPDEARDKLTSVIHIVIHILDNLVFASEM